MTVELEHMSSCDVKPKPSSSSASSKQDNGHLRKSTSKSALNNNDLSQSEIHGKQPVSSAPPQSKKFTVYLNGAICMGINVTIELDQLFDWNDFMMELDSGINFSSPTNEVYSTSGALLQSIEEVLQHDILVVGPGSGQRFIPLQYEKIPTVNTPPFGTDELGFSSKSIKFRGTPAIGNRKSIRSGLAKSVCGIDETDSDPFLQSPPMHISSPNELHLLKTASEEQVCFRDKVPATPNHCQLPNSVARQTRQAKPRPVSCYGSSQAMYSSEASSPIKRNKVASSRIPKRIMPSIPSEARNTSLSITNVSVTIPVQSVSSPGKVIPLSSSSKSSGDSRMEKSATKTKEKGKGSRKELNTKRDFILPRIVSVIRTGTKPRKVIRYLLNQKTARSFEQVLSDMTERLEAPWGAIRKVFTLSGLPVETLEDFFRDEKIFLACPNDRHVPDDFMLDPDEVKAIPNCLKFHPNAVKMKSGDVQRTPQKKVKSITPRVNQQRTLPGSYPTHPKYLAVSQLPSFILNKYYVGDIIGDGNFAVVRDCVHRISGEKYALKVIDKTKSGLDAPADYEVRILKSVKHPNIIHVYEDFDFEDELFVVMEHVPGGDLFDTIAQCAKFSEEESGCFTRDIVSALSFLHSRSIVHRDIKPENLLVYFEGDKQRRIKVGDFGLAHYIEDDLPLYTVCGTPTYVAPEILAETGYSYKVDVWAMGIILYILLCGYPPFASNTGEQADLFDLILVGDYEFPAEQWDGISEDAKDLIMKMIESDVDVRLTADEVLDHPWLCATAEDAEAKRNNLFKRDFRFNVFEQMGLTKLGLARGGSSAGSTPSTSFETSNSS